MPEGVHNIDNMSQDVIQEEPLSPSIIRSSDESEPEREEITMSFQDEEFDELIMLGLREPKQKV